MLLAFALRNTWRHRARSAMTVAAIAFGVAALIETGGFIHDLYFQLGEAIIHSQSGHLQIARPELFGQGSRSPEKHRIVNVDQLERDLTTVPGYSTAAARLSFVGLLNNTRSDLPIAGEGIEPDKEAKLGTAIQIVAGRMLTSADRNGALIGDGLARALALKPGDPVTLVATTVDGAMNTTDLEVMGVFRSFSKDYDAHAVKIPLAAAQELTDTRDVNSVVLLLDDTAKTEAAKSAAMVIAQPRGLSVRTWQELNDFYRNTVELYDRQFGVLKLIILFMVLLGVSNAVNMAVFERLGEFGTMRALGNRSWNVVRLVALECIVLGIAGAAAGVVIGVALAWLLSAIGIPMPPPPNSDLGYMAHIALDPGTVVQSFAVGAIATLLAGTIPALRARRVPIVDALRHSI